MLLCYSSLLTNLSIPFYSHWHRFCPSKTPDDGFLRILNRPYGRGPNPFLWLASTSKRVKLNLLIAVSGSVSSQRGRRRASNPFCVRHSRHRAQEGIRELPGSDEPTDTPPKPPAEVIMHPGPLSAEGISGTHSIQ